MKDFDPKDRGQENRTFEKFARFRQPTNNATTRHNKERYQTAPQLKKWTTREFVQHWNLNNNNLKLLNNT